MGTSTRKRQGKTPAKIKDLPTKAKRAKEIKGGSSVSDAIKAIGGALSTMARKG